MKNSLPNSLFLYFLFLLSSGTANSQTALKISDIVEKSEISIFVVYGTSPDGASNSQGSGFFIDQTGIGVTNFHVLANSSKAWIKTQDNKTYPITNILGADNEKDLVKFSIENPFNIIFPFLDLEPIPAKKGDEVLNISTPLGLESTISTGIISAIREIEPYGQLIQITAPISPGSSGSPILNLDGKVVGVATFTIKGGQNLNFAVSSKSIETLDSINSKKFNSPKENIESFNTEYKESLKKYLADQPEEALEILNKIIAQDNNHHKAYNLIGQIFLDAGMYEQSIEYFFNTLKIKNNPEYLNNFGIANAKFGYVNNGDRESFTTAYDAYSHAIDLNPKFLPAYFNRAYLVINYLKIENPELEINESIIGEALSDLEKGFSIDPYQTKFLEALATVYIEKKDYKKAKEYILEAIKIDQRNPSLYFTLGEINGFGLKYNSGGIANLEKAESLTTDPRLKADIIGMRAILWENLGHLNEACKDAQRAYSLDNSSTYKELIEYYCK